MAPSVPALGAGFDEFLAEEALQVLENTADADCLALRYGGEVSLRGSRGLCLSVAPVKAGEAVAFAASVAGLGLGRREERFVIRRRDAQEAGEPVERQHDVVGRVE